MHAVEDAHRRLGPPEVVEHHLPRQDLRVGGIWLSKRLGPDIYEKE